MHRHCYFFSDIHLGLPNAEKSRIREKLLVKLLDEIKDKAKVIYFAGDIFDFWWEYKKVVPRGFVRFLGKIAELSDSGIEIHFFTGNHDIWMRNYLSDEIGVKLHRTPLSVTLGNKRFYIAHGDGLGPGDRSYKLLKKLFSNSILQWIFSRLHPNFAFGLAHLWSHSRRKSEKYIQFRGADRELLFLHAQNVLKSEYYDFFVFGHRHIPLILNIGEQSKIANIGEWLHHFTFLEFAGENLYLKTYKSGKIEDFSPDLNKAFQIKVF